MSSTTELLQQQNSAKELQKPQLSDYQDYRLYLKDFFEYKKAETKNSIRPYTYSIFSAAADIKSPNYLKLIIEGKRNLSEEMINKFAKALDLSRQEITEFVYLVQYGQASDPGERNSYLRNLAQARVTSKLESGEIDQKTWNKIPSWITWVLYAMTDQSDVDFTSAELIRLLRGKASSEEIEEAITKLVNSGELERDPNSGQLKKSRNLMDSAQEVPVALIRKLQSELMYLGLESLFHDTPAEREFGSLTVALTQEEFEELKFQLRKIRKTIQKDNAVKRLSTKGDRIYQLNLQLFPITNVAQSKRN